MSQEQVLNISHRKTFFENFKPMRIWLWLVCKITANNCHSQLLAELIRTQTRYPTSLDKMSILTWRLLVISRPETDLGLLQHPRWSAFVIIVKAPHLGCCSSPRSPLKPTFFLWTKPFENLLFAKYLATVVAPLNVHIPYTSISFPRLYFANKFHQILFKKNASSCLNI